MEFSSLPNTTAFAHVVIRLFKALSRFTHYADCLTSLILQL